MVIITIFSFHNYRLIYRNSLLQLFKAEKQGEKKPESSWIIAVLSLLLGAGYAIFLQPVDAAIWEKHGLSAVMFSLLVLIAGTYLFIGTFMVLILKQMSQIKAFIIKA